MPTAVDLELCSLALMQIGCEPVPSHVLSRQGELCERIYPHAAETLLTSYPWSFAAGEVRMVPLAGTFGVPEAEMWEYAYAIPSATLRVMGVRYEDDDTPREFALAEGLLWAAVSPLVMLRIRSVAPSEFPPYFRAALVAKLAYYLCLPLTEQAAKAKMLFDVAELEAQTARRIDAQSKPSSALKRFPLVEVR